MRKLAIPYRLKITHIKALKPRGIFENADYLNNKDDKCKNTQAHKDVRE